MRPTSDYRWRTDDHEVIRSICWSPPGCHGGCGILLHVQNGQLVKVEGDQQNHYNRGWLCVRGLAIRELLYHPDRLLYPLLRKGQRGQNRWTRISWDEAYDLLARRFSEMREEHGPESVIFCKGTARDIGGWLPRLCYGFGSPNYFGFGPANGNACYRPRVAVSTAVLGGMPVPDLGEFNASVDGPNDLPPKCILIWGANPIHSHPDGLFGGWVRDCLRQGSDLIVIDPQKTWLASKARHWLQIKPGTDGTLALGMLRVILDNQLYDKAFCQKWVAGIEDVHQAALSYSPEKVAEICQVSPAEMVAAARHFAASKPANLIWGVGVDMHPSCLGTIQGLIALVALTGNVENPGGMVLPGDPLGVGRRGDDIADFPNVRTRRIGAEQYPLLEVGNPYAQPDVLLDQLETGRPYPIKAAWLQGVGVIPSGFAEPQRVLRLFKSLSFTVMVDVFMNPAAVAFADLILPAAMFPEKDSLYVHFAQVGAINQALEPAGECRSDAQIILEVGRRLASDYFPWKTVPEWIDERLRPAGLSFAELQQVGSLTPSVTYDKQELGRLRPDSHPGFNTPSGKIELHSSILAKCSLNPLPHYNELSLSLKDSNEYPLTLTTGSRKPYFFCMEHRQAPSLRAHQHEPEVCLHPETAVCRGIAANEDVLIVTPFGQCRMKARISDQFAPNVVQADSNWWYPERTGAEPELFGVHESNVNALLPSGLQGPGGFGYPFRGFPCEIRKVEKL